MADSTVKRKGGRPGARFLDWLRTRAWLAYLKKTLRCSTNNALKEKLEAEGFSFPVTVYMDGGDFPHEVTRTLVSQIDGLEGARGVYEIGPEIDGENVPLWSLFEEAYAGFSEVIDTGLTHSGKPSLVGDRVARVGQMFLEPEQWQAIRAQDEFVFEANNPIQQAAANGNFTPDLRTLAAAIACWRLCMLSDDGVAPVEYLLRCLLAGPYKPLLEDHLIYSELAQFMKLLAIDYHGMRGNWEAAEAAFGGLGSAAE